VLVSTLPVYDSRMSDSDEQNPVPMSWQARFLRETTSWYLGLVDVQDVDVQSTRKRLDFFAGMVPIASGVHVRKDTIAGLHSEWLTPDGSPDDKLLLYWHGGAYVMGSCASHRPCVSHIAREAGIRALVPEYRLAPEYPFPAAVEDSVRLYRALLEQGYEAKNIAIAGDSAGGGLCVAMLLSLRDQGVELPAAAGLLSPWLDLSGQGESMTTRVGQDPWFNPEDLPHVTAYYCSDSELTDPLVSPVFAQAAGLPPTLIQVGDDELLLSDSERLAENMRASGGAIEIDVWPGMWHVWQMFIGLMPESRDAVVKLGNFIKGHLSKTS
jgi:monoterpene epsilon-lactone hydrolase